MAIKKQLKVLEELKTLLDESKDKLLFKVQDLITENNIQKADNILNEILMLTSEVIKANICYGCMNNLIEPLGEI